MPQFTKTEAKILADLANSRLGRISITRAYGRGAYGGKIDVGKRERDAALTLEAKGLLVRIGISSDHLTNRGYTIHATDYTFTAPSVEG
jgi:hypothetical protein